MQSIELIKNKDSLAIFAVKGKTLQSEKLKTLTIDLILGIIYAFGVMLMITYFHKNVSISYIFILPLILGATPFLLSTKEQLPSYKAYLLLP